jgi:hypothetical protein
MPFDADPWRARLAELDASPHAQRIAARDRRTAAANAADRQALAERRAAIAQMVADAVIAALPEQRVALFWLHPGSELTDKAVQRLLDGGDGPSDVVDQLDEQWLAEQRYDAARQVIRDVIGDDTLYELLDADPDLFDKVRFAVEDADTSDPLGELLANTGSRLLLIPLGFTVPDHTSRDDQDALVVQICEATGVDPQANHDTVAGALAEAPYGGQLTVIVYAAVADAVGAVHVRITDPHLLIHDTLHGSGADCQLDGTIDLPLEDGTVRLDSQTHNGWDSIAGVVGSAYAPADSTWIHPEPEQDGPA